MEKENIKIRILAIALSAIALFGWVEISWAANDSIYLDCDTITNGIGTISDPKNDVSDAVAQLTDGEADTLYMKGVCTEALAVAVSGQDYAHHHTIRNWPGNNVIFDGSGISEADGINVASNKDFVTFKAEDGLFTVRDWENYGFKSVCGSGSECQYIYINGLTFSNNGTDRDPWTPSVRFDYVDYGRVENVTISSPNYAGLFLRYCDGSSGTKWIVDNVNVDGLFEYADQTTNYSIFSNLCSHINITNCTITTDIGVGDDLRGIMLMRTNNFSVDGNNIVASSIVDGSNALGIQATSSHTGIISENTVGNWAEDGYEIDLDANPQPGDESYGIIVERNLCYNAHGGCFEMADGVGWDGSGYSNPIILRNNIAYVTSASVGANATAFGFHGGSEIDGHAAEIYWFNNTAYTSATGRQTYWLGKSNDTQGFNRLKVQNNVGYNASDVVLLLQGGAEVLDVIQDSDVKNNSWYRADDGYAIELIKSGIDHKYTSAQIENGDAYAAHLVEPGEFHVAGLPYFVNAPVSLALQEGDARIDAGMAVLGFSDDYLGTLRPQGSAWDIGAFEYIGGENSTPPAAPSGLAVN